MMSLIPWLSDLTPVWAPAEPPAKRAKTAKVRLSSASDVPITPRSDNNAKSSSDEEDSDSSGSNSDCWSGPTNSGTELLWSPK